MPLAKLAPVQQPADFDVQQTDFNYDVLGRYVCNDWGDLQAAQANGAYPFDVVVIGSGMFGGYIAEKLYRLGAPLALRTLVIDGGAFLLPSHIQNLPQRLGGTIGGSPLRTRDDGPKNVIWGMPWISNEGFPGLAYCLGGRSLFWGGWSPRLTANDLTNWPSDVASFLTGSGGNPGTYDSVEVETGVVPSTDYIRKANLFNALTTKFTAAQNSVEPNTKITVIDEAPLAVQGSSPASGLLSFDKFSSGPFLIDAVRDDSITNEKRHGDVSRRLFLLPKTQVLRLGRNGSRVTSLDLIVNGQFRQLSLSSTCTLVLANGTIEATRLALDSLGVGNSQFGAPRLGNLMGHLRSNVTVRIKRTALGLPTPATDVETTALIVRGESLGRRFHLQVTAAAVAGADPEKNLWSLVPDIDLQNNIFANQDPNWTVITLRGIGEMEDQRSLQPNPAMSWVDLSSETDQWGVRRAFVNLVATQNDYLLWAKMDRAVFDLATSMAGAPANIEYLTPNGWSAQRPQPDPDPRVKNFWQDNLGTTHHEAGTLFMGTNGASVTDTNGKFHNVDNAYVAGPAVFPTLGSANPSLTGLSLSRRTAAAIVKAQTPVPDAGFTPLSLDPKDWQMVTLSTAPNASMRNYGQVLETFEAYGLSFYVKEQFKNFRLKLEWRVGRLDDNSGVYIRTPGPSVANALQEADNKGHEIQIDEIGFDSATNSGGHPEKRTGAIYNLQAPSGFPSNPVGVWNTYLIEANGAQITVRLNGQVVNVYTSTRQNSGFIALQAHHRTSRVQFRNLQIQKLP
jgi:choline dehydrogenase-like flavoprotein